MGCRRRRLLLALAPAAGASRPGAPAPGGGGDPACFAGAGRTAQRCCGHPAHAGPCLWGALLSDGYCCDGASDCFAWGALIRGDDVARPLVARTGLECRHLCQAEPRCSGWTFVLPSHASAELRHSCWLKARAWSEDEASGAGEPGVVSGSRHCPPGHDRVLLSLRSGRTMDLSQEPGGSVVRPSWNPSGYAREAAESMRRAGWTVVRGALGAEAAGALRAASERVMLELLRRDPEHAGNRGPRRYSLGSASLTHHMVHLPEWAALIDNPVVTPILQAVFQGDYLAIGGGGDLALGQTDTPQWLHVDLPRWEMYGQAWPPPGVGVNFAVHDIECGGGHMRLVPATHTQPYRLDRVAVHRETAMLEELGLSRVLVCPLRAGDAVMRDLRVWHAGSPNQRSEPRHFPNAEFLAGWYADLTEGTEDHLAPRRVIPDAIWRGLSAHGQRVSARAHHPGHLDTGLREEVVLPQQYD